MAKNKVVKTDFEQYLAEARSWETNKVLELNRSKRTAWRVAAAGIALAVLGTASAAYMATKPAPIPVVLRVDNNTGGVDVVEPLSNGKTNYEEAINKYFTQWYVRYREGYSREVAEEYYFNVGIMSVGVEQQRYYDWFNPKNPQSPLNVYSSYARVRVQIKSTSFIRPNVALVRYTKAVDRGSDKPQVSHWASTITFKYSGAPMSEKDRGINPVGFQVVEYRNDPDAATPDEAAAASAPTMAPPTAAVQLHPAAPTLAQSSAPGASVAAAPLVPAIQR